MVCKTTKKPPPVHKEKEKNAKKTPAGEGHEAVESKLHQEGYDADVLRHWGQRHVQVQGRLPPYGKEKNIGGIKADCQGVHGKSI